MSEIGNTCNHLKSVDTEMRVDKFLQLSRLVKRRTAANALCSHGNVLLNNQPAKAGKTVNVGDRITIISNRVTIENAQASTYEILEIPTGHVSKASATTLYRLISQ